jgi:hypothetical protein
MIESAEQLITHNTDIINRKTEKRERNLTDLLR